MVIDRNPRFLRYTQSPYRRPSSNIKRLSWKTADPAYLVIRDHAELVHLRILWRRQYDIISLTNTNFPTQDSTRNLRTLFIQCMNSRSPFPLSDWESFTLPLLEDLTIADCMDSVFFEVIDAPRLSTYVWLTITAHVVSWNTNRLSHR